jgi:Cu2+-exporting ATPase
MQQQHVRLERARDDEAAAHAVGASPIFVAIDDRLAGMLELQDQLRDDAPDAVRALRARKMRNVIMLSGDHPEPSRVIADTLGLRHHYAELLPEDKARLVRELKAEGRVVAMVGDGVNDAPALAQADVGIAIGAGTDVAIETAEVVLMRSDPLDVSTAITIGRGTVRKMRQNLTWAIGYNSVALPIAAGVFEPFGLTLRPEIAAISMSGSSILVAVNALALKRLRVRG